MFKFSQFFHYIIYPITYLQCITFLRKHFKNTRKHYRNYRETFLNHFQTLVFFYFFEKKTNFLTLYPDFERGFKIDFFCLPDLIISQIEVPYKYQFLRKSEQNLIILFNFIKTFCVAKIPLESAVNCQPSYRGEALSAGRSPPKKHVKTQKKQYRNYSKTIPKHP